MSLFIAGGVRNRGLSPLRPVLRRWQYLNSRIGTEWAREYLDSPWWYNERASLSFFAGAVWSCGGWALEEFSSVKKPRGGATSRSRRAGRYDVNFGFGPHEYLAEAKQCWPLLTDPEGAKARLTLSLRQAASDARAIIPWGLPVLSMVFATPRIPVSRAVDTSALITQFLKSATQIPELTTAWSFPVAARSLTPPESKWIYPGVLLLIRLIRKAA
jgi:hypothetical protein